MKIKRRAGDLFAPAGYDEVLFSRFTTFCDDL